jgi:endogenous inhibitor of DNA gyrase (YacG/DUF329 family)
VAEFLIVTQANRIDTFTCPVCGEDLRNTFQKGLVWGRGNCVCCKMGVQMQHRIAHEGHTEPGGFPCEVVVTYPVSMCDPELQKRLRKAWTHLHGETQVSKTGQIDLEKWIAEAKEIQDRYNTSRKIQ